MTAGMSTPVVLISGGMGGIGRAIATRLSREGYRIALFYHNTPKTDADAFLQTLSGTGHCGFVCDITDPSALQSAVVEAHGRMGRLDVCVHAAVSPLIRKRASGIDPQDFKQQFDVTTFGGLCLFQAVTVFFQKQKRGRLIALTTAALDAPAPSNMAGYVCAKSALRMLMRELAGNLSLHISASVRSHPDSYRPICTTIFPRKSLNFCKRLIRVRHRRNL